MIAQLLENIRNNPDWIPYGLAAIVALALLSLGLLIWRRAGRLAVAQARGDALEQRLRTETDALTELTQQHSDLRIELAAQQALAPQYEQQSHELAGARRTLAQQSAEIARLSEALRQQQKANAEKVALLNATSETLRGEFKTLASEVLKTHSEDFKSANQEQLQNVLQPLRQNIDKFERELREVHKAADRDRVTLKAEIENLTRRSLQVSQEAENLTRALKADSQKQGAWGEMILASILDRSGLREGEEYETQAHMRGEDGNALRPDVVVNLPGGRKLVIDSKVSLVAYERAVNAETPEARALALKAHIASVKTHIDTLSAKKYHELDDGSVDYVLMFVPVESAFSEAMRAADDLALYATGRDVVIASPTNLMVALKTVENLWSVERRNRNAMEIAKRAGRLYDKFHGFLDDMLKVGDQLDRARRSHDDAMGKLAQGRGNLVSQVETLKKLGAKTAKQISLEHDADDAVPAIEDDPKPS